MLVSIHVCEGQRSPLSVILQVPAGLLSQSGFLWDLGLSGDGLSGQQASAYPVSVSPALGL